MVINNSYLYTPCDWRGNGRLFYPPHGCNIALLVLLLKVRQFYSRLWTVVATTYIVMHMSPMCVMTHVIYHCCTAYHCVSSMFLIFFVHFSGYCSVLSFLWFYMALLWNAAWILYGWWCW